MKRFYPGETADSLVAQVRLVNHEVGGVASPLPSQPPVAWAMVTARLKQSGAIGLTIDSDAFVSLLWYGCPDLQPQQLRWDQVWNVWLPRVVGSNVKEVAERFARAPEKHAVAVADYVMQPVRAATQAMVCAAHCSLLENISESLYKLSITSPAKAGQPRGDRQRGGREM